MDVNCYDRYWDGEEFYEDDTMMDGAFKMYDNRRIDEDGMLDLSITIAKKYKSRIGSHNYELEDG